MHTCAERRGGRGRQHLTARKKREEVAGCKRGVSFHTAYVRTGWDRNRSPGFSDRPNQCKQLDIAGNISFLRAVRRSTAKRAETTTTTMTASKVARDAARSFRRKEEKGWKGEEVKKKRKRIYPS